MKNITWLEAREHGIDGGHTIGGSEAGMVLTKEGRAELYGRKKGTIEPPEQTPAMAAGRALEPGIIQLYSEHANRSVVLPSTVASAMIALYTEEESLSCGHGDIRDTHERACRMLQSMDPQSEESYLAIQVADALVRVGLRVHYGPDQDGRVVFADPRRPWMVGTFDCFALHPEHGWGVVDTKNRHWSQASKWRDDDGVAMAPPAERAQLAHYTAMTGFAWSGSAVLFGGCDLGWVDETRNETFEDTLLGEERSFVDALAANEEPPIEPSAKTLSLLKRRYAHAEVKTIDFPKEGLRVGSSRLLADEFDLEWRTASKKFRDWRKRKRELEAALRAHLKEAQAVRLGYDGICYDVPEYWHPEETKPRRGYSYRRVYRKSPKRGA